MDKKLLLNARFKYLWVETTTIDLGNDNFNHLLQFIGENNKERVHYFGKNKMHENIGVAYIIIRREANSILGAGFLSRLKTSKKEIASIRMYYESKLLNRGKRYVKIPYKIVFIFRAIIKILEEIRQRENAPAVPPELSKCINVTYETAFYKEHIKAYNNVYDSFKQDEIVKRELRNDFNSPSSPFRKVFKK